MGIWAPETLTRGSTRINLHDCRLRGGISQAGTRYGSTPVSDPESSRTQRQRAEWWLWGSWFGKLGSRCSVGTEVRYGKMISGTDGVGVTH